MTVVSKASAFPKSVQPGIPALGPKPMGWLRGPLSAHLFEQQRPIRMSDDAEYRLVTVKRSRGGVVTREHLKGREISVKSQFLLHPGDFLISKRQIVHGACGIVPAELEGSIASNEYAILRGKPTVDLEFLNYLAHSIYFQQTCFHSSIGVHVEKMIFKLDRWLSWDFDLPPLPEQRKIAEVLSTWDAAISAQERLIANAKHQKKALMQTLLPTGTQPPKKRLPGFTGEWVRRSFGSFAESEKRRIDPKSITSATKCVELEHIEAKTGALLGFCDAKAQASLKSVFEPGHILYGKLRPYLRKFYRPDFSGVCSTEIWSIKANEKTCLPDFLYYLIQSPAFEEAVDVSSGSKMPRADWGIVKGTTFQLPGLKEQRAIFEVLDTAETELTHSQEQLTALRREKSALMQQLLTGKRRVKLEEAA